MEQYAVLHVSKGKGASQSLTAHNERQKEYKLPSNVNPKLGHLNIIDDYSKLGKTLEDRAKKVIEQAGVQRKIQKDAVLYCPILLSGSHERMAKILETGRIDEWVNDNKKFIEDKFGADNVISFAMHADETTPHIHCSIVPIVNGGRKKAGVRLSAKDKFNPAALKELQTEYAAAMQKWELNRGMDSSTTRAKHQDTKVVYRDFPDKIKGLKVDIKQLEEKKEALKNDLKPLLEYEKEYKLFQSRFLRDMAIEPLIAKINTLKDEISTLKFDRSKFYNEVQKLSELKKYEEMFIKYGNPEELRHNMIKAVVDSINKIYDDPQSPYDANHRFYFPDAKGKISVLYTNDFREQIKKDQEAKLKAEQEAKSNTEQNKGIKAPSAEVIKEGSKKKDQGYHM